MSTCPPIADLTWRLLEGDLDEVAEEELALHLERCPACREALRLTVRTHRVLIAQGMDGALGAGTATRRFHAGQRASARSGRRRSWTPLLWTGGILAAAALVLALVLDHGDPRPDAAPVAAQDAPAPSAQPAPAFARLLVAEGVQVGGFAVEPGTVLIPGSALVVARAGRARLELADGTVIAADPDTRFVLRQHATRRDGGQASIRVDLEQGLLAAQVRPQDARAPLVFRTPLAEAVVVGTELTVRHASGAASELAVTSGQVLWAPTSATAHLVGAGQHARVGAEIAAGARLRLDSLVGITCQGRNLCTWKDARGKGPQAQAVGRDCTPYLATRGGRQVVDFCARHQRLEVALEGGIDPTQGLTLLVVMEPQGSYACKDEHILALVGDGVEELALLRSGLPACLRVEGGGQATETSQTLAQGLWTLACRVDGEGRVELLRGTRRLVTGRLVMNAARQATLFLGGDAKEASLAALVYALEWYPRPLSDAEIAERFAAIARLHALEP